MTLPPMDKMLRSLGLAYAFIVGRALAFPRAGLAPTQPGVLDLAIEGRSPIPTALADAANPLKLFRREETRTCGYIDGDYDNPATCGVDYYCAFNSYNGAFGCCSGVLSDCYIETACYPSAAAVASCDSSCLVNPYHYICTAGVDTLCYQYVWVTGTTEYTNFGCGPIDYTSYVYDDYTNGPTSRSSISREVITVTQVATPTSERVTSTPTPTTFVSTTTTGASAGLATTTPSSGGSKTPVGAIVGGVVGGIAVIAIAATIIAILIMKKKRQAQFAQPQFAPQPAQPQYMEQPKQPYMQQAPVWDNTHTAGNQGGYAPTSPPMSPPVSPAPPYGHQEYQQPSRPMPKGVHEAP
ncbi:hypothetical protein BU26DRAFT_331401 [Trematosphaeria pertusa]|uniref:Mid2 domain-containing protein n=1 Tax=Trematosphaeria pertusa TaxID=390896 RepID=A0A6A6IE33_9PLEO|nr:uncharacterized protein BU26DRAFT_331401 [Trematosphaeria pertusa]KAF2248318.1 hypothetical protein BU26DRAFT_331401 [Trematosphaeria pertusa]